MILKVDVPGWKSKSHFQELKMCFSILLTLQPSLLLKSLPSFGGKPSHCFIHASASHFNHHVHRYFRWYRLAAVYRVLDNMLHTPPRYHIWDSSLALGGIMIWILNGAYCAPWDNFRALAQQASQELLDDPEGDDEDDPDAPTHPLMYDAGVYFICDIECDTATNSFCIAYGKEFMEEAICRVYKMGTLADIHQTLGVIEVRTGPRKVNANRTQNRSARSTTSLDIL